MGGTLVRQYTCYAPGCGKQAPFDLNAAVSDPSLCVTCPSCGKKWAVTFKGRTCCALMCLFSSVEPANKTALKKMQTFKV